MKLGVVILAAGKGTRMRSTLPKVLHPLAGRPLLGHVLDAAVALGAAQVCVVYGHGGTQVPAAFPQSQAVWVEQAERLGTGHAVLQAMPAMATMDRVLVLYGDVPLIEPETLNRLIDDTAETRLGLLTMELTDPTGYGRIVRDKSNRVLRIVEQKDASTAERAITEVNTGIIVAERACLADWLGRVGNDNVQREYYLTDVIGLAVGDGVAVATCAPESPEEVAGVNDRAQLAQLERHYQHGLAHKLMRDGTSLADPTRIDVRGSLICDQDVFLDVNLICEGRVRIGANCRIGPNCFLRDCTLGTGVEVFANSIIDGATVAAGARIGPFARLRPETEIAEDCHIGNFVEVKKSHIAAGSKVNHLSYIGDAEIGAGVNVGAGTITCNYDGAHKHLTQIGDGAFIGSNTALVAPVTVGTGATIGAGSVISRDAPAEKLTLTRARQATIEGWQRPVKSSS
ncbi:bifunctional UDP-N-acetylglucosamine diphosphorylase/glucosamine-1-phosphate N-acetyltransferase GlmU [Lamprobacter modestohalophilus]|uniref:bifunctional UDP-N-acetylglucosamine diphosphorylase/glucosamine-1-phosphate N-acetyltransferase GlmU n=1 Tax=Lamprobacter modestohalophilus TaxID=1064514 RepID=UPI002ADEAC32|nr:bifunctional UDP-N-acetylglucosamine diphosphorylase/glucosamine-1-phosphate N-acetyltransferase GlmU [Lamprobacter modestohalophilus]MEA1050914.1 bifunctional UDP-N-acetylglucosamine diphosphorylase/glucosamine-1-phosphate N-acetyltransferase GlmU [Lamprobacter modestohalophilus]